MCWFRKLLLEKYYSYPILFLCLSRRAADTMNGTELKYAKNLKPLSIRSESGTEDVHYPLMYEGLPEKDRLYAQRELNETEENKVKGVRKLKEYIKKQGLTCPDDSILEMVLRNCKYNISKSESKLKRFLKTRQLIIHKIAQMDMEKIEFMLNDFPFLHFPWRDREGRIIMYSRPRVHLDKYEQEDLIYFLLVNALFFLQFPLSTIYGFSYIADSKEPTLSHYMIFKCFRRLVPLLLDLPYRFARVDLINEDFFSRWVIKMLYPFLPQKIKNRMMFHGAEFGGLLNFYPRDILPDELGGTLGPISSKCYREELFKFIKRLREGNLSSLNTDM